MKIIMNQEEQDKINKEFIKAVKNGDLVLVKSLLNQGADINSYDDNDYVLKISAEKGHLEVVEYLVEHGVDIHTKNNQALIFASIKGHLDVVKYLVEKGADIHALNDYALKLASFHGYLEIVKFFLFDCQIEVKKGTKKYLKEIKQETTLELIEKRDLLFKLNKKVKQKISTDKKIKI